VRISSTYHPLRPWRAITSEGIEVTPPPSPSFELQSFVEQTVEPHRGFTNLLYVNNLILFKNNLFVRSIQFHSTILLKKHSLVHVILCVT